jgi:hypothetical protein
MRRLMLASLLLSLSLPAFAVYKCESNGKTVYSDTPCPDGKQVQLASATAVAEPDAARARQDAKQEKAEATRLEKERHKREAAEEKQAKIAARSAAVRKRKCETLAQRVKWSEEDAARAAGRSTEKAKRKARRAAESYDLQCK